MQIIQRRKDNPHIENENRVIKTYYIYSQEYLDQRMEEIIGLCTMFNARAYIHLNRRNAYNVSLEMLSDLAHNIKSKHLRTLGKLYDSVCGKHHSEPRVSKTWVVDIDTHDVSYVESVESFIDILWQEDKQASRLCKRITTRNGFHLVCSPFDSQTFSAMYPSVDVHKNNPTILFMP